MKNPIYKIFLLFLIMLTACEEVVPSRLPAFSVLTVSNINTNSATISGDITDLGNQVIEDYGITYSEDSTQQINENAIKKGEIALSTPVPVSLNSSINGLKANTTYYVSPFIVVNSAPMFGQTVSFKTSNIIQPTVNTVAAENINHISAKLNGSLTARGTNAISEYGIVWATTANPTTAVTTKYRVAANVTNFPHNFTTIAGSLSPNTTYYFRAYVISGGVTSYGQNLSFSTSTVQQPGIRTDDASDIGTNTAVLKGTVLTAGSYGISEYGIVYGTAANPTTSNTKKAINGDVNNFPRAFSVTADGLALNTTYNYRAYVISNGVTTYGANQTFKTIDMAQPAIVTGNASDITINSAKLGGSITAGGTHAITERGVVWATSANPTTSNSKVSIAGNVANFPNNFTIDANGLALNTTYNYRAYVIMNGVTSYGENKTFKTQDSFQPKISTGDAKASDNESALMGTITERGSHAISEYGVVWGTAANPTTGNSKASVSGNVNNFPHSYTVTASGLSPNTRYNYRAYVIMNGTTTYGDNKIFTTGVNTPSVTTVGSSGITVNSATLQGRVSSAGSYPVTEIGIAWGTSNNPTTANNKASKTGTGVALPHTYTFNATGLSHSTTYYYRAYVISNGVVYYGNSSTFRTPVYVNVTLSTSTQREAITGGWRVYGTINAAGSLKITEYGIAYWPPGRNPSTNVPTFMRNTVANNAILATPANFNKVIPNTAYGTFYYSAYAITSEGKIHYGTTRSFVYAAGPN